MPFCVACGSEFHMGETSCATCRSGLPAVEGGDPEDQASASVDRWPRLLAGAIDVVVAWSLLVVLLLAGRRVPLLLALRMPLSLLAASAYLLVRDMFDGKSVGKLLGNVVVVRIPSRRAAGFADSVLRNWPLAIPLIGPTVIAATIGFQILSGRKFRLGERGSRTMVVSDLDAMESR